MNKEFTVSFFGQKEIPFMEADTIARKTYLLMKNISETHPQSVFITGRNGGFDTLVSSCSDKLRKISKKDNFTLLLILRNNEEYRRKLIDNIPDYYDDVIICRESSECYPEISSYIRDRYVIGISDAVVFFFDKITDEIRDSYDLAVKMNKEIILINKNTENLSV